MTEVKLNKAVFDSKANELKSSASALGKIKFNDMKLNRTNLTRLTQFCEAIENLSKKVQQYEQLLQKDINRIQQTGEKMVEQDEKLGKDLRGISAH